VVRQPLADARGSDSLALRYRQRKFAIDLERKEGMHLAFISMDDPTFWSRCPKELEHIVQGGLTGLSYFLPTEEGMRKMLDVMRRQRQTAAHA
jgi:hypothetical protein